MAYRTFSTVFYLLPTKHKHYFACQTIPNPNTHLGRVFADTQYKGLWGRAGFNLTICCYSQTDSVGFTLNNIFEVIQIILSLFLNLSHLPQLSQSCSYLSTLQVVAASAHEILQAVRSAGALARPDYQTGPPRTHLYTADFCTHQLTPWGFKVSPFKDSSHISGLLPPLVSFNRDY